MPESHDLRGRLSRATTTLKQRFADCPPRPVLGCRPRARSKKLAHAAMLRQHPLLKSRRSRKIAFGKKIARFRGFKSKLISIAGQVCVPVNFLMATMAFETERKFTADVGEGDGVGLIQFTEPVRRRLHVTRPELAAMSELEQLTYVHKYFDWYKEQLCRLRKAGHLRIEDVYVTVLAPGYLGRRSDEPLAGLGNQADRLKDSHGNITMSSIRSALKEELRVGKKSYSG